MKIMHCGHYARAKVYRIVSSKPAYAYQILYLIPKCKGECNAELMFWEGEHPNGKLTPRYPIPQAEFAHWKRRAETEKAKPEIQLTSEYSSKMSGPIDGQIKYLALLNRKRQMPLKKPEMVGFPLRTFD